MIVKICLERHQQLLEAVKKCDLQAAGEWLRPGARAPEPWEAGDDGRLFGELFACAEDNPELSEKMPEFVQLFLDCGHMLPHGADGDGPIRKLACCRGESALKTFRILLDNGLDRAAAESLVECVLTDIELFNSCETSGEWFMDAVVCGLKMTMPAASYPRMAQGNTYIGTCIGLAKNRAEELPGFRSWNDFHYYIDLSTCTKLPQGLQDATVTIRKRKTGRIVWQFLI
jgi:hypothetical protein